ncbi:hypothetical protein PoB_001247400 [Plakobranchus ocellatus]|uniref:Uncharacterized protein n=1 Tax=Plakobranchus ocellatus TaxID=259542 RepID=A0AAV3YV99_9GAST|nr:hypothetical protein PoB_001247400 [Plakobranchus ocellatus]
MSHSSCGPITILTQSVLAVDNKNPLCLGMLRLTVQFCLCPVDLTKLRLSDSSGSAESGAYTDTLLSPDLDDYTLVGAVGGGSAGGGGGGTALLGGFCCASFPLARGLARTIKRL